jgi:hypothetical protein
VLRLEAVHYKLKVEAKMNTLQVHGGDRVVAGMF